MQDSVTVHTMGYKVERPSPVYKYNGVTNFADGSASPFVSISGKVLIKFDFTARAFGNNSYPRILDNGDWGLYPVTHLDNHLVVRFKKQDGFEYVDSTIPLEVNKRYSGTVLIDTLNKSVTYNVNGIVETIVFSGEPINTPSFKFIGRSDGGHRFNGTLNVELFDIGNPGNNKEFKLDPKLGALVAVNKPLGDKVALRGNHGTLFNRVTNTYKLVPSKYSTIISNTSIDKNKTYLITGNISGLASNESLFHNGKTVYPALTKPGGNGYFQYLFKPSNFGDEDLFIFYRTKYAENSNFVEIIDLSIREIDAWPINQFSDAEVTEL